MTGLYGSGWMQGHGGTGKQAKNRSKCAHSTCFVMHVSGQKKQKVNSDGRGDHTGSLEGIEGN